MSACHTIDSEPPISYAQVARLYQSNQKLDKRLLIKEPANKLLESAYMRRLKFDHDWRSKHHKSIVPPTPQKVTSVPRGSGASSPEDTYALSNKRKSVGMTPVKRKRQEVQYPCYLTTSPKSRVAPSDNYMYEVEKFRLVN